MEVVTTFPLKEKTSWNFPTHLTSAASRRAVSMSLVRRQGRRAGNGLSWITCIIYCTARLVKKIEMQVHVRWVSSPQKTNYDMILGKLPVY